MTPTTEAPSTSHDSSVSIRLSVMMFLQFFAWGAWYVTAYLFLGKIGFGGGEIKWTYSVGPIAGIISPFFVGMIADRFFSTERVLGVLHLAGGAIMLCAVAMMGNMAPLPFEIFGRTLFTFPSLSMTETPSALVINLLFFGHMLCYFPTLSLTNSLALHNMTNAEKQFPAIRVWGTIGWIVAGLLISWQGWDAAINLFWVAGVAGIVMGFYSFTLPHTPPPSAGQKSSVREILGLDALVLLKNPSFLTFIVSSFLICIPLAFYYQMAGKFVDQAGLANPALKMSFGQMSEIIFMIIMPLFFARLGVKWMLLVGMLAWVARYALFALGASTGMTWAILIGIVLHGICYDFFFVTGQIYTDQVAPSKIRGQAQGMLVLFTLGLGMLIGAQIAGVVEEKFTPADSQQIAEAAKPIEAEIAELEKQRKTAGQQEMSGINEKIATLRKDRSEILMKSVDWKPIWAIPAVFAGAIMILFGLIFKEKSKPTSSTS